MTQARNLGNLSEVVSGASNTNISFDSDLLYIDSVNNRVGINKNNPNQSLDISGNVKTSGLLSSSSISVSGNTTSGNVSVSGNVTANKVRSSAGLVISVGNGANSVSLLANGVLRLSGGVQFSDGTVQTSKSGGGGLNSGIVQTVTAVANTVVDLSLGDFVNINMSNNITTLRFSNANTENQIVLVNLVFDANTRTVSNIANCNSSIVISSKDVINSFELFTNNYGNTWIYTAVGTSTDSNRKSLWIWGQTLPGTYISSPVQVGTLTDWKEISCGDDHYLTIKSNGTLWSWGYNGYYGEVGLNNRTYAGSPVQIGSFSNWSKVYCGTDHSLSIKTDGTLWSWGRNGFGQLGQNDTTHRSSPAQVGSLTTWSQVAGGDSHSLALKTDGTLWCWGYNAYGQLGLGDRTYRSSPVQVGTLTNWSQVAGGFGHSLAIKTDGTLWSWGNNYPGQLGLGDITNRSSPVQVGSLTNWSQVFSSNGSSSSAIKTDGTLWSWGSNSYGKLGLNDTTSRNSPVQVGTLTTWSQIACGYYHSLALKTDGTLWSWGGNSYGRLGLGDFTHRSSPAQIGSLTVWTKIAASGYGSVATQ